VRPHVSKAGKPMGFAEIEDVTGRIELVIFPKTWEKCQDVLQPDHVVVVFGKAEVREGRNAQVLADKISDSVSIARSADAPAPQQKFVEIADAPTATAPIEEVFVNEVVDAPEEPPDFWQPEPDTTPILKANVPPAQPEPPKPVEYAVKKIDDAPRQVRESKPVYFAANGARGEPTKAANQLLRVVIRRSGNANTDIERMEAVCAKLREFKGQQRFCLQLRNGGKDQVIDFPNDTTLDCDELRLQLKQIGAECVL